MTTKNKIELKTLLKNNYPLPALIVAAGLFVLGIFGIIDRLTELDYIGMEGFIIKYYPEIELCIFFIIFALFIGYNFIADAFISPRKKVLYLKENDAGNCKFVDIKNITYLYEDITLKDIPVNTYYEVLKTKNVILDVIDKSNEKFDDEKKEKYWYNLYTPFGNTYGMFLPVIYIFLIVCMIPCILSQRIHPIYSFIVFAAVFFISYDITYKLRKKSLIKKEKNK
jgi:hypothetical protein